jgi:hypothetical protein
MVDNMDLEWNKKYHATKNSFVYAAGVSPMQHRINNAVLYRDQLLKSLCDRFLDYDQKTLCDPVEGPTNLYEMLEVVVRSRDDDITLTNAPKSCADEMNERLGRLRAWAN